MADHDLTNGEDEATPATETDQVETPQEELAPEAPAEDATAEDAPAEEELDPVEAKRRELARQDGDWYVIHSYSGHERRVKANLEQRIQSQNMEAYIYQVEVPMETVTELSKAGKKKKVDRVRIPG